MGTTLAALLIRVVVAALPPTPAMLWDHHQYVQWSAQMLRTGLAGIYVAPPPQIPMQHPRTGARIEAQGPEQVCNYPPLALHFLYGQGLVLRALQGELVSNTVAARLVYSGLAFACDMLVAAGAAAIVVHCGRPRAALVAFVVAALAPPFIIDSARWGQTEAWLLAPLVGMLLAMLRGRWVVAGLLWGVALALKPQAVLAAPIWLLAGLRTPRRAVILPSLLGPAVLLLAGLPFTLTSGWAWLRCSYLDNLLHSYPYTTLKAFNIWYLDLLISESDDSTRALLGLTPDSWGKVLLAAAGLGLLALALRRRLSHSAALLTFTAGLLLAAVIFPTRVHERYLLLPLPFLIAAAGMRRRLWWGVAPLLLAATLQLLVLDWIRVGAHVWSGLRRDIAAQHALLSPEEQAVVLPPEEVLRELRPRYLADRATSGDPIREWALTTLELAAAAACLVLLHWPGTPDPPGSPAGIRVVRTSSPPDQSAGSGR